jgi:hypothetical protein
MGLERNYIYEIHVFSCACIRVLYSVHMNTTPDASRGAGKTILDRKALANQLATPPRHIKNPED